MNKRKLLVSLSAISLVTSTIGSNFVFAQEIYHDDPFPYTEYICDPDFEPSDEEAKYVPSEENPSFIPDEALDENSDSGTNMSEEDSSEDYSTEYSDEDTDVSYYENYSAEDQNSSAEQDIGGVLESKILTNMDSAVQAVDLTNGTLYFNDCTETNKTVASFNEQQDAAEQWDTEKVEEYLGDSIIPDYISENLILNNSSDKDGCYIDDNDETIYWSVGLKDGQVISDRFVQNYCSADETDGEESKERITIEAETAADSGTNSSLSFGESRLSTINGYEILLGTFTTSDKNKDPASKDHVHYAASFTANNVTYQITSDNLSQKEFVKILLSMPVFES